MKKLGYKLICGLIFISPVFYSCGSDDNMPDEPEKPGQEEEELPGDDTEEPGNDEVEEFITNLSEEGLANCYIVLNPGKYKLKADNQFNLGEGLPVPPVISPVKAELVWQSGESLIKGVELIEDKDGKYVSFEVVEAQGNALLSVLNSEGEIEWSWHIWMPKEAPHSISMSNGYEVMNMNLGALDNEAGSVSSYGLLYQWGRKDPFPSAGELTGTTATLSATMYDIENNEVLLSNSSWSNTDNNSIAYSISHPMVVLSNYSQFMTSRDWLKSGEGNDALWGNPNGELRDDSTNEYVNKGVKTCYDPSPLGWRVPPVDVFKNFTSSGGYAWDFIDFNIADINGDHELNIEDYNYGWHFYVNEEEALYFPAASRFDGSYAMLMGSMSGLWGNYWSNSPYKDMTGGASCVLAFQVQGQNGESMITVSPSAASSKADAFSIRCIKDN